MPRYIWVPRNDNELDNFAFQISDSAAAAGGIRGRPIRRGDGGPTGCRNYGEWDQLLDGDTIYIIAHGRSSTTKEICWQTPDGIVNLTHAALARELVANLGDVRKGFRIRYDLLVCWSADSRYFSDPFACRLALDMRRLNCRGEVVGYKGAVTMYGGGGSLLVQGSGRFTSKFGSALNNVNAHRLLERQGKDGDPLYIDKFNYYDYHKQQKSWAIR